MSDTSSRVKALLDGPEAIATSHLPTELAQLIVNHEANLLEIVRASSAWLINDDDSKRGRGIGLLANVVVKCTKDAVTKQEARTLTEFFASCLDSKTSEEVLIPAVEGVTALARLPAFTGAEAISVCKTIFDNVDLLGRPQTTRYFFYCLMDVFVAHHRKALKRMGSEFLAGYAKLVTGEKDPRNLRVAFTIARVILVEFDISQNTEELFDITFCYFPITFTPPPNDPYGITSEELQVSLRRCLAATPRFGPLALPLLLEKLSASTATAKRQTLQALVECFPVYGKAIVLPHAQTFWEALNLEIFHASDAEMERHALLALKAMLQTLYANGQARVDEDMDDKNSIAFKMCEVCMLELNESDKSNATPATKILSNALAASGPIANYVAKKVFPRILQVYKSPDEQHQRPSLLGVLARLLEGLRGCPVPQPAASFAPYREEVLSIATSALQKSDGRQQALDCLIQLVQLPKCLDDDELVYALQSIVGVLVDPSATGNTSDVSSSALEGLDIIAILHARKVETIVLPPLFNLLPDRISVHQEKEDADRYRLALGALATLCVHQDLFESLAIRILSRLDLVCASAPDTFAGKSKNILYAHHLLTTLRTVLQRKASAGHTDIAKHADRILVRLYSLFAKPAVDGSTNLPIAQDARLIDNVGRIAMCFTQQMDEKAQTSFAFRLHQAFFNGRLDALLENSTSNEPFAPFSDTAPRSQRSTCPLFAYPICAMRKEAIDDALVQSLCPILMSSLPYVAGEPGFDSLCRLLAVLLNKKVEALGDSYNEVFMRFWSAFIEAEEVLLARRRAALRVWAWAMRGLILRSDSRAYDGVAKLVTLFQHPQLAKEAARTMSILGRDDDGILIKPNFANIKLLHRQRFFSYILPKVVEGYKASSQSAQSAPYLVGLSCLLQNMPKSTVIAEMPKLLPLLLRALDLEELDLRAHVIDTFATLTKDSPDVIKAQAAQIADALLTNVIRPAGVPDSENHILLRISALKCLAVLPDHIDWLTLHRQKTPVLKVLGTAVDDPRKAVRKEAVDCRAVWYLFKAP